MTRIQIKASDSDIEELNEFLLKQELRIKHIPNLNLSSSEIVSYLTIGGGFLSVAKIFTDYLKVKHQTRKLFIKKGDGSEINIEGNSVEEVEKLLQTTKEIVIVETNITNAQ